MSIVDSGRRDLLAWMAGTAGVAFARYTPAAAATTILPPGVPALRVTDSGNTLVIGDGELPIDQLPTATGDTEFTAPGTGSATITLAEKAAQSLSTADKAGAFLTQLNSVATDLEDGGLVNIPRGNFALSDTFTFDGQRLNMRGEGPNVSVIQFAPASAKAAIVLDTDGSGGQYQSSIDGLTFASSNSVDKIGIDARNVANVCISRIGIGGGWGGSGSTGIRTGGRQFIRIRDCELAVARPIVIGANPEHPTLAGDYTTITSCELICTEASQAALEIEQDAIISNFAVRDTGLIGGKYGFRKTSSGPQVGINTNLSFENVRTEQGTDPTAWSFDMDWGNDPLRSCVFTNILLDNARNGLRIRNTQRVTLINVDIDQLGTKTLIDMVGIPGSVLTMINCWGQAGGVLNLVNMRKVQGLASDIGSAIGPLEQWIYTAAGMEPFTEDNGWHAGATLTLANDATAIIGPNTCRGYVEVYNSIATFATFTLRGTNNAVGEVDDWAGQFSAAKDTASSTNVYYESGNYIIQNKTGGSKNYRIMRRGPGAASI